MVRTYLAAAVFLLGVSSFAGPSDGKTEGRSEYIVRCASNDERRNTCYVGSFIESASVYRQLSKAQCVEGVRWGYTQDSIWVDRGCRADFRVIVSDSGGGGYESEDIHCSSFGDGIVTCQGTYGQQVRRAELLYVEPNSAVCIQDRTWGMHAYGVWVTYGCRGIFRLYY